MTDKDKLELIDRAALTKNVITLAQTGDSTTGNELSYALGYNTALLHVKNLIQKTPTIDAAPVRRGEWKLRYDTEVNSERWSIYATCSECCNEKGKVWAGFFPGLPSDIALATVRSYVKSINIGNFCPNCGADMRTRNDGAD